MIQRRIGRVLSLSQMVQKGKPTEANFRFDAGPTIKILNGNRFMTMSRDGNMEEEEHGLFRNDTRFLSTFIARINGKKLTPLTSNNITPYSATFYLTNQEFSNEKRSRHKKNSSIVSKESLAIQRTMFIERDVREEFSITNVTGENIDFTLSFSLGVDYEDLFELKDKIFGEKPDMPRGKLLKVVERRRSERAEEINEGFSRRNNELGYSWKDPESDFRAETVIWFSEKVSFRGREGDSDNGPLGISLYVSLKPKQRFHLAIAIIMLIGDEKRARARFTNHYFEKQERKIEKALEAWHMNVPSLRTNWDDLRHSYRQSLTDLLFLRMPDPTNEHGWVLLAAGYPWFMTLFGRDTLITSYQSILLGSTLARGAIAGLSEYQAKQLDDNRDEQPGKIIHELRYGDHAARSNRFPYYGTADATQLYLILFSETFRWTKDIEFAEKYRPNVMAALEWIDRFGDIDEDGFVEYIKRSNYGLDNQGWKDSWNAIQFEDGRIAEPPIATCEIQGYVYDAKARISEIARDVWKDSSLAKKLSDEANELKKRFNEEFWIEHRGYYALALDRKKKRVDSLTSNCGQLFWSGIVEEGKRADTLVEKLLDEKSMFSGYGVRTFSQKNRCYNPIGYHTGSVWAHDNSLIVHGLAKYGKHKEAYKISAAILEASPFFGYSLPETFAGFPKRETLFPVRYPTSCSPQAWAAGASLLLLRTLVGISPSSDGKKIEVHPTFLSEKGGIDLELEGLYAFNKRFDIELKDGSKPHVHCKEA